MRGLSPALGSPAQGSFTRKKRPPKVWLKWAGLLSRRAGEQQETKTLLSKGTSTILLTLSPSAEAAVWKVPWLHLKANHWQILGHMPEGQGSVRILSDGRTGSHLFFLLPFHLPGLALVGAVSDTVHVLCQHHWLCPGVPLHTHPAQPAYPSQGTSRAVPCPITPRGNKVSINK